MPPRDLPELEYAATPPGRVGILSNGVEVDTLQLYYAEVKHSPTGFAWGYSGSGPAQLAYALLRHALEDRAAASRWYQQFKERVIAPLSPGASWKLKRSYIVALVASYVSEANASERSASPEAGGPLSFYTSDDTEILLASDA